LNKTGKIDLVFWFHGWNNNIDTAIKFYEIEKQFIESKRNAILVMVETAKNAPDSLWREIRKSRCVQSFSCRYYS
jgi:hypothetical protein